MSIEIGKEYVIVNSPAGNNGKRVTVASYAGKHGFDDIDMIGMYGDRYFIDCKLLTNKGNFIDHIGEKQLKPIDDNDSRKVTSWEELKDIWTPPIVPA